VKIKSLLAGVLFLVAGVQATPVQRMALEDLVKTSKANAAAIVRFEISDFGFKMQDSSDFEISITGS